MSGRGKQGTSPRAKPSQYLVDLRKARSLSQSDLAGIMSISRATVGHWERGVRNLTVQQARDLATLFAPQGATIDRLVELGLVAAPAKQSPEDPVRQRHLLKKLKEVEDRKREDDLRSQWGLPPLQTSAVAPYGPSRRMSDPFQEQLGFRERQHLADELRSTLRQELPPMIGSAIASAMASVVPVLVYEIVSALRHTDPSASDQGSHENGDAGEDE